MKTIMPNRLVDYFVVVGHGDTFTTKDVISSREDVDFEKISFKASILDRFPFKDYPDTSLTQEVPLFCLPGGVVVTKQIDLPTFFTFVLTGGDGARLYGSCLTFFEQLSPAAMESLDAFLDNALRAIEYEDKLETFNDFNINEDIDPEVDLNDSTDIHDNFSASVGTSAGTAIADNQQEVNLSSVVVLTVENDDNKQQQQQQQVVPNSSASSSNKGHNKSRSIEMRKPLPKYLYATKSICILSHWPLFSVFKTYLTELYRISTQASPIPIERYISNFCLEVPLPPPGKIQVQCSIGEKSITIARPPLNELPLCDVPFEQLFLCLDINNIITLFTCVMVEKQILFYSSHYSLMGTVAQALCSFMFPFHWHHVYIPLLPKNFLEFLSAPVPFIMGIHSKFFNPDQCPKEVVRVDLDNNKVIHNLHLPRLPERQVKKLRQKLSTLTAHWSPDTPRRNALSHIDMAFNAAPLPEEADDFTGMTEAATHEFPTKQVRMAFFRFFVSLFAKYRHFLKPDDPVEPFKYKAFIRDQPEGARPFLTELLETQALQRFIEDRIKPSAQDYEAIFFDESIEAKMNRSVFVFHKKETPFLNNRTLAIDKTDVARAPDTTSLPPDAVYTYPSFPRLNKDLFAPAREVKVLVSQESLSAGKNEGGANILASWKTILATLASLSKEQQRLSGSNGHGKGKFGRIRSIGLGRNNSTLSSIGEDDDQSDRMSIQQSETMSVASSTVSFAGATLFVDNISVAGGPSAAAGAPGGSSIHTLANSFSRFRFDTHDTCPNPACNYELNDHDIRVGWSATSTQDYRTTCPKCNTKFVARFTVLFDEDENDDIDDETEPEIGSGNDCSNSNSNSNSDNNESNNNNNNNEETGYEDDVRSSASHSSSYSMKFEYLSPILLKKEVENLLTHEVSADEHLFQEHPMMFWNLIVHFRDLKIPLNFLLPQINWRVLQQTIAEDRRAKMRQEKSTDQRRRRRKGNSNSNSNNNNKSSARCSASDPSMTMAMSPSSALSSDTPSPALTTSSTDEEITPFIKNGRSSNSNTTIFLEPTNPFASPMGVEAATQLQTERERKQPLSM